MQLDQVLPLSSISFKSNTSIKSSCTLLMFLKRLSYFWKGGQLTQVLTLRTFCCSHFTMPSILETSTQIYSCISVATSNSMCLSWIHFLTICCRQTKMVAKLVRQWLVFLTKPRFYLGPFTCILEKSNMSLHEIVSFHIYLSS